jgi:O-antigen/teichoic acid export membrane protein
LNLLTQPVWFLLEGCNQIAGVAAYRASALAVSGLVLWTGIGGGGGLLAAGWAALAGFLVSVAWLAWRWRGFVHEFLSHRGTIRGMLGELWPFQWRMALSAMSGYLIFSLFEPTVFRFRGAAEAGRMGMSWQLVNALSVLSVSWISTRAPRFGMLVREARYAELDRLARRVAIQAVGICLVGAVTALALLAWVKAHFALGERFLGLEAVALLAGTAVLNQVVFAQAYYLRAHKQEPFMLLSLLNGLLTAAGVLAGTWHYGALGACVAYAAIQLLIFPLATGVFLVKRREWHRAPPAAARRGDGGRGATAAKPRP